MKIRGEFFTSTETKNEYGETVVAKSFAFSTGVETKAVSFKDKLSNGHKLSGEQLYVYAKKNPNTTSIGSGDFVVLGGNEYEVQGVDVGYSQVNSILFIVERKEAS